MTTANPTLHAAPNDADSLRSLTLMGAIGALALMLVLVFMANFIQIGGAVISYGQAVVRGKPQLVQSLDGGLVKAILVKNGDHVQAGQPVIQLDDGVQRINLDIAFARLSEALARKARLEAEQMGLADVVFSYPSVPFALPDMAQQEAGQRQIFEARAEVLHGRRDQLNEKLTQITSETKGLEVQIAAKADQMRLLEKDVSNAQELANRGLMREAQLNDLQRNQSELLAQLAALEAELARTQSLRGDSTLETLQAERAFREQVVTELREVTGQVEELLLDIATRSDQLKRAVVLAPSDGIVHQLQVVTVGGVVAPGATLLEVVPVTNGVDFELRVDAKSVDQIYVGQSADLLVSALNSHEVPKLKGSVSFISPGTITDPSTKQTYYEVDITVPAPERARLGDAILVPGMPVEGYLETGERSIMAYLLEPLNMQLRHAFREE
jgi:HlyD family secretion protein